MARDTGFPTQDAQDDFLRARRRRVFARLSAILRLEPGDVDVMLPFDEVVDALGRAGERDLGVQTIPIDSVVGTVDRGKDFDREFRPTSSRARLRFERIAEAQRRGVSMPPIDVYRVGELHFVRDGPHRVAVARAQGRDTSDAHVVEVVTRVPADRSISLDDLPLKSHERLFYDRVPLPPEARKRIHLSDEWTYAALAEAVEAWGFRVIQARQQPMSRHEVAEAWFREEYEPVVEMLQEAHLMPKSVTDTEDGRNLMVDSDVPAAVGAEAGGEQPATSTRDEAS